MKQNTPDTGIENLPSIKKLISVYTRTTGSTVDLYDRDSKLLPELFDKNSPETKICRFCPLFTPEAEPCRELHINAVEESGGSGGIYTYTCKMGLAFWTSPLYHNGCYSGCLRGSGYLKAEALSELPSDPAARERMDRAVTPGAAAFMELLANLNIADTEKVKSLAEMLLLCAASLSQGKDYHDALRRRADQQKAINSRLEELKAADPSGKTWEYPIQKEQELITVLRLGDAEAAASCLNDLLAILLYSNADNFKYMQLRALELAALLSRTDKDSGYESKAVQYANYPFIRQIKTTTTFEELTDALHSLIKQIVGTNAPFRGIPHAAAMRKAVRFIQDNYTRKISLAEIAAVAGISAPYFSTIFRKEMGENFSTYLNRMRVEKVKHLLLETELPLSEIAGICCFEDQSWFSRIFKTFTGISPGKFRSQGGVFKKF
jgi:AraC-like DNA-binding protein/ligand-binding sensor protein